tara:strand:- start:12 stop:1013 length:1002 start_codon:yes stop_codon:yes gene_type:complete
MSNIQTSIIERVKTELNVSEELNAFELHKILYSSRNSSHPDLFEDSLKEKATERFKTLDELLKELKIHIDGLKLSQSPKELAIFEKSFESVIDKSLILELENKNKGLEASLSIKKSEIDRLKKEIEKQQLSKSQKLNSELREIYKPVGSNFIVLGISAFLILFVNVVAQIKTLKDSFLDLIPFDIKYVNYILFAILIYVSFKLLLKNWKYKKIQSHADDLKSSSVITEFYRRHSKEHDDYFKSNYFLESDLDSFIYEKYAEINKGHYRYYSSEKKRNVKYRISRFWNKVTGIAKIRDKKSLNHLRDIFIYNLLTKGYIRFGKSKNLDREFLIE